jgi:hypothetical protein
VLELLDDVDDRGRDATEEDVWWVCEGTGDDVPNNLLVEENNREGRRRLLENLIKLALGTKDRIQGLLTASLQSNTFFSIQGIKQPTTNSLANLDVCWISSGTIRRAFT